MSRVRAAGVACRAMSCDGRCYAAPRSRPDSASDEITQSYGRPVFSRGLIHSGGHGNRQARPTSKSRFGAGFLGEGVDVVGVAGPDDDRRWMDFSARSVRSKIHEANADQSTMGSACGAPK